MIGGIHVDELSSISVMFKWLKTLTKHHSGKFHWRITLLMNPDGALMVKAGDRIILTRCHYCFACTLSTG